MNTIFSYFYEDDSRNRKSKAVIFSGTPQNLDKARSELVKALEARKYFVAEQVDVPVCFSNYLTSEDNCWHRFDQLDKTPDVPTDTLGRSFGQFLNRMLEVSRTGWKPDDSRSQYLRTL